MDIWLEWWLPSGFLEDPNAGPATSPGMLIGHRVHSGALNSADMSANVEYQSTVPCRPCLSLSAVPLPKHGSGSSYWGNQLLTNDQGIDFACTPKFLVDTLYQTVNSIVQDPEDPGPAVPEFPHDDLRSTPSLSSTARLPDAQGELFELNLVQPGFGHHFGCRVRWQAEILNFGRAKCGA